MIAALGSADEEGAAEAAGEGGAENFGPGGGVHGGVFVKDDEAETGPTYQMTRLGWRAMRRVSARARDRQEARPAGKSLLGKI